MEKDILEKTYELGEIGLVQGPPSPATEALVDKYLSDEYGDDRKVNQQIGTTLSYLIEQRYLHPYLNREGKEAKSPPYARGITPKGIERLKELQHPRVCWIRKNWFPLTIAAITALIGTASIIVNAISMVK